MWMPTPSTIYLRKHFHFQPHCDFALPLTCSALCDLRSCSCAVYLRIDPLARTAPCVRVQRRIRNIAFQTLRLYSLIQQLQRHVASPISVKLCNARSPSSQRPACYCLCQLRKAHMDRPSRQPCSQLNSRAASAFITANQQMQSLSTTETEKEKQPQ